MKHWIVALAVVAMLGMTGLANAGSGKKSHGGIHGKIQSISGNTVTLTVGGHKNPHTVTVTLATGATIMIDGASGKLDSTLVGKRATVDGAENNGAVTSSTITVTTKHHAKKPAA
ncbi:MAG TPA: hypothetical protein VG326_20785 [Tepidisphaeraceae bacterium]|nr:hypothetical protein [Tepidisphaeraceae bacterium]